MKQTILLTGTPLAEPAKTVLTAGNLKAVLDGGALRWITWKDLEITRALMFLLRTPGWGTPAGELTGLTVEQEADSFRVSYSLLYGARGAGVIVDMLLVGRAAGEVIAEARITAEAPFETNRAGLVLLHPLDGFVGQDVTVEHGSGPDETTSIPILLSPGQPVMDMRAITHSPVDGLEVHTRFDGDVFEMEDHRMWTDASLKTYNRPIALPHPYTLDPARPVTQSIRIRIKDSGVTDPTPATMVHVPELVGQTVPRYALPIDRVGDAASGLDHAATLRALAPSLILLRHDASREPADAELSKVAELINATGAGLELQAILTATSDAAGESEVAALAARLAAAGLAPDRVSAFPKIDEQSFQPGQPRPDHPSEAALSTALARHFPDATRIGGTPAFFTEFNRKRPDPALWHGVTWASTPVVHAHDDVSIMETLQALPHVLNTARTLVGDSALSMGPTGIGARINPYAAGPVDNAPDQREGMAARDPRQRGLFAAAWCVGYLARIVPFDVDRLAFGAATGPFGLISTPQDHARPVWDDLPAGAVYPIYHVARWIAGAAGAPVERASTKGSVACVAWKTQRGRCALVANISDSERGMPETGLSAGRSLVLDSTSIEALAKVTRPAVNDPVPDTLGPYAVAYIVEEDTP